VAKKGKGFGGSRSKRFGGKRGKKAGRIAGKASKDAFLKKIAGVEIEGQAEVIKNLRKIARKNVKGFVRGLVKAGLMLQRESQKIVPIDTGALKNSAFTRKQKEGLKTEVLMGYTMDYAIFVHEDPDAQHAPGKEHKYLEKPAKMMRNQLRQKIIEEAEKVR
jgi:hypothetical protein